MEISKIIEKLPKFRQKNFSRIYTVADMETSYIDYVKNIKSRKIAFGIPALDNALGLIRPAQIVTIIAGTDVGKTSFLLNMINYNARAIKDKNVILFECEINQNEVYERLVQMRYDVYTKDVETAYLKNNGSEFINLKWELPNVIGVIHRISIEDIIPFVLSCEELSQKQTGFIGIDYLGLVKSASHIREYDRVTYVMQMLKEIALHLDIPIINLSQPSRQDLKEQEGLSLYSGKHSGEVENSSQIVITIDKVTKENFNKHKSLILTSWLQNLIENEAVYLWHCRIQKKKQGKYASCYLLYNTRSTLIYEYNPDIELKINIDEKLF